MAGEGMEDEEALKQVPPSRFLQGIKKWKRAIIMIAGVTLNFILGFILLFVSVLTTPVHIDNTSTSMNFYTLSVSAPEGTEKVPLILLFNITCTSKVGTPLESNISLALIFLIYGINFTPLQNKSPNSIITDTLGL